VRIILKRDTAYVPKYNSDCKLHVLLGEDKVLFENGVAVDRADYDLWTKSGNIREHVEGLSSDPGCGGFDYRYAVTTGYLRHKGKAPPLPPGGPVELPEPVEPVEPVQPAALAMLAVMSLVGAGSAVMSAYHTTAFLFATGKPAWTAAITGVMLILFSVTAFTAARYVFREGGGIRLVGGLFVVAGLTVVAYSMFSTLSVNYSQYKTVYNVETAVTVADSEALAAHGRLLGVNQEELDELAKEIDRLELEAEHWRDLSWQRYDVTRAVLVGLREKRERFCEERRRLETEKPGLVETASVSKDTVYSFLARVMGLPEDTARFFVFVLPAVLYDVLAPFALTVVLILWDGRRKHKV
jgi:hypothetical protein